MALGKFSKKIASRRRPNKTGTQSESEICLTARRPSRSCFMFVGGLCLWTVAVVACTAYSRCGLPLWSNHEFLSLKPPLPPKPLTQRPVHLPGNHLHTEGNMEARAAHVKGPICESQSYTSSPLEQQFLGDVVKLTQDAGTLCSALSPTVRNAWLQGIKGNTSREFRKQVFSVFCRAGETPEIIEPLAGILRDPRYYCEGSVPRGKHPCEKPYLSSIEWIMLADGASITSPGAKKIMFDAGGSYFMDAMMFFTSSYGLRGIDFDEIYVWEATPRGTEFYWKGVPEAVRQRWEPRLKFYDGVPISAEPGAEHNPVNRILKHCKPSDFCAFKLDIDTPSVELPIVRQMLQSRDVLGKVLDEFFFEHHVQGLMQVCWGGAVQGTFKDSYDIFLKLRQAGIRAHSWI